MLAEVVNDEGALNWFEYMGFTASSTTNHYGRSSGVMGREVPGDIRMMELAHPLKMPVATALKNATERLVRVLLSCLKALVVRSLMIRLLRRLARSGPSTSAR